MSYPKLVWMEGLRGKPTWQIWWHEAASVVEGKPVAILASHDMSPSDQLLAPSDLIEKYPPPLRCGTCGGNASQ